MPSAFAEERVALLIPQDEEDDAGLIEDVERVDAAHIRVFTDFEAAMGWLLLDERGI